MSLLWLVTACGGGESANTDTTATTSTATTTTNTATTSQISYTGLAQPAVLTTSNASQIAASVYKNGSAGKELGRVFAAADTTRDERHTASRTTVLTQVIEQILLVTQLNDAASNSGLPKAANTIENTISGSCGGSFTYTLNIVTVTRSFSGLYTFDDYCTTNATLSGSLAVTGEGYDADTQIFSQANISLENLAVDLLTDSFTIDGDMSLVPSNGAALAVTFNALFQDNNSASVYQLDNWSLNLIKGADYLDVSITGIIYLPEYGSLTIITTQPFHYTSASPYPAAGSMVIMGAANSTVTLTALSSTTYQIDTDINGDGAADMTVTGSWADELL